VEWCGGRRQKHKELGEMRIRHYREKESEKGGGLSFQAGRPPELNGVTKDGTGGVLSSTYPSRKMEKTDVRDGESVPSREASLWVKETFYINTMESNLFFHPLY